MAWNHAIQWNSNGFPVQRFSMSSSHSKPDFVIRNSGAPRSHQTANKAGKPDSLWVPDIGSSTQNNLVPGRTPRCPYPRPCQRATMRSELAGGLRAGRVAQSRAFADGSTRRPPLRDGDLALVRLLGQ